MMRLLMVVMIVLLSIGNAAAASKKKKKEKPVKEGPRSIKIRGVDIKKRVLFVELTGFSSPPAANLFTMTDSRDRHYVAAAIRCAEPAKVNGPRNCELEIPSGYEKNRITDLLVHQGGLHGKPLKANTSEVQAAWDAAEEPPGFEDDKKKDKK